MKYFDSIKNIVIYFDGVQVVGEYKAEHKDALSEVIKRAKEMNIKFKPDKLQFKQKEIKYLGLRSSSEGVETGIKSSFSY